MPHITAKVPAGTSEEQKQLLAEAIVEDVVNIVGSGRDSISVAIEEVAADDWREKVYEPFIRKSADTVYVQPGYAL